MISLIFGRKGSGKTKKLIELVNKTAESSAGSVVCIEKTSKLTYDISNTVRLMNTDAYSLSGFDQFYGFICGVCAGNYDITDIFVDATFRIGSRDYDELEVFLRRVEAVSVQTDINFTFTISADKSELPEGIFEFTEEL